jgi:hypothetical protein
MVHKTWTAAKADVRTETPAEITALIKGFEEAEAAGREGSESAMIAVACVFGLTNPVTRSGLGGGGGAVPSENIPAQAQLGSDGPSTLSNPVGGGAIPGFGKPQAEAVAATPPAGTTNPMGIFAKKDTVGDAPSTTDNANVNRPVNWDELTHASEKIAAPAASTAKPVTLDEETKALLKKAGENTRKALFDDKDKA